MHARRASGGSPDSLGARASLLAGFFGSGRRGSGRSQSGGGAGNASPGGGMKRCGSGANNAPTCLICLEYLTPEDFEVSCACPASC